MRSYLIVREEEKHIHIFFSGYITPITTINILWIREVINDESFCKNNNNHDC